MEQDRDAAITIVAARQAWAFTWRQARAVGLTNPMIQRRLAVGRWRSPHRGVLTIVGPPRDPIQALWAAVLAVGPLGLVSHEAAAALGELGVIPLAHPVLTDAHGRHHRLDGVVVHQLSDVWPHHRTVHAATGLPITTPARTIVDLAAVVHPSRLKYVLDEAVAGRRVDVAAVSSCLADVARKGKPGVRSLGRALDERTAGRGPVPSSRLEQALNVVFVRAGLPEPVRQLRFPGRQDIDGCVDFGWPEVRMIVEGDGRRWHTRIADLKRDHERDVQAARAGWQTIRFLHESVVADPDDVGRAVRETYDQRSPERAA